MDEDFCKIDEDEMRELREVLENGSLTSAVDKIRDYCQQIDHVELNIAITGVSGAGKSTFVNAFLGMKDGEEGAAETGPVDITMVPSAYPHPNYPQVKVWDLPGIGTPNFKADEYLEIVEFQRYDFFIIISSERFREYDVQLANEIQSMKKKLFFVRSKIDNTIDAEKRKKNFDKDKTLSLIRQKCVKDLQQCGVASPMVFLISSFDLKLYDFLQLEETMERELPKLKQRVLLLSLPNITLAVNQRKKEALQANVWKISLLAGILATLPVPGLPFVVDLSILDSELRKYHRTFGLDHDSLLRLSEKTGVPLEELNLLCISSLKSKITVEVVKEMLMSSSKAGVPMRVMQLWASTIPLFGGLVSAPLSFYITHRMLTRCLNELAADAHNVLMRALQTEL